MGQANMNKKLFPIYIALQKVTLIIEICGGGFVHIVCTPCQLESKKQNQNPIKEFLLVHSNRLLYSILTIRFLGFKGMQASMERAWLKLT